MTRRKREFVNQVIMQVFLKHYLKASDDAGKGN